MDYLPNFIRRLRLLCLLILPISFVGCVESDLLYLLNADGSGKVTAREKIPTAEYGIKGKEALEQVAIGTLAEFVLLSKGVDAWESMHYQITPEGDLIVEATALFPDLSKLKLFSTATSPTLTEGLKFNRGGEGKPASIELRSPIAATNDQDKSEEEADAAAMEKEIAKSRKNWEQNKEAIRKSIGTQRAKITLHLPGTIMSSSNFEKDSSNQVSLEVTSGGMIDILEKVITDDELAKEVVKTGAKLMANSGPPPIKEDTFNKLAFGEAAPINVRFDPKRRVFDYRKSVAGAKANPSELVKRVITESKRK